MSVKEFKNIKIRGKHCSRESVTHFNTNNKGKDFFYQLTENISSFL